MPLVPWISRALAVSALAAAALAQTLGVGDPAPKLRVATWVRGEPITSFERDHVYVVDLWATWCLPCRKSMPHLSALQQRFADQGVHVVGVSVKEDRPADVEPFVAKLGDTVRYAIASDQILEGAKPDQGAMVLSWLKAAGEIALPTVFVVDRSGKIAWIGDTLAVEKPLEQIVAGTWNLDLARAEHHKRVKINALRRTLNEQIRADQWELQLATIEAMRQLSPESEVLTASWRFRALLSLGREPEAYAYGRRVTKELLWEQPLDLNVMAWAIVDPEAARRAVRDLEFALLLAERAVALTESKHSAVLDTLALVHFERGNLTLALELQEQAVKLAENSMYYSDLVKRLEQFREAKRARDSKRAEDGGRLVKG